MITELFDGEVLRDVPGYEGKYAVTSDGRVWSRPRANLVGSRRTGRWLAPQQARGYLFVVLYGGDGARRTQHVQRLVAAAWLPPADDMSRVHVNHIDGDKTNNDVANLEWVSPSENIRHAFATGLSSQRGSRNAHSKLSEADVAEIRQLSQRGVVKRQIARLFGVSAPTITNITRGKTWTHV